MFIEWTLFRVSFEMFFIKAILSVLFLDGCSTVFLSKSGSLSFLIGFVIITEGTFLVYKRLLVHSFKTRVIFPRLWCWKNRER